MYAVYTVYGVALFTFLNVQLQIMSTADPVCFLLIRGGVENIGYN